MFMIFVLLTLVEAVEQSRHVLVRRHEALEGLVQQDDAEPQSQAAKASKAWDSLPYSSFAGKKDSKVHPDPEKSADEAQTKVSMEVSATGAAHRSNPGQVDVKQSVGNGATSAPATNRVVSEEKWIPSTGRNGPLSPEWTQSNVPPQHANARPALLPDPTPSSLGHLSESISTLRVPKKVTAEALAVAVAAEDAAQWTGASIQVSPANHTDHSEMNKEIKKGPAASFVEAAQIPMVSAASPVMSAVPQTVVADAAVATATTAAATTAAATTAAATTAAATTAAATTAAATTAAGTTVGTTEEEEPETTEEKEEEEEKEVAADEEEEDEGKKGAGQASFVEQHFVLLAAGGVGMVTLLVIGLVCCCRR